MVDPATLPELAPATMSAKREHRKSGDVDEERKIELSEIIGLPDFDVRLDSSSVLRLYPLPLSNAFDPGYEPGSSMRCFCQVENGTDEKEAARRNLTAKAWAYMKSGATDERSKLSPSFSLPHPEPHHH
jgi:hypothetical protein